MNDIKPRYDGRFGSLPIGCLMQVQSREQFKPERVVRLRHTEDNFDRELVLLVEDEPAALENFKAAATDCFIPTNQT
jgi:hypothetical protein